jgi:hypothetical protein
MIKMLALPTPAYRTQQWTLTSEKPQNPGLNFMANKVKTKYKYNTRKLKVFETKTKAKDAPIFAIAAARPEPANSTRISSGYQQELAAIWRKKLVSKISQVLMQ